MSTWLDALARRLVPALPRLSHNRALMAPLDAADWLLRVPYRELRGRAVPPNRFRIRVGVGNRLLGNAAHFKQFPVNFWLEALAAGVVRMDSNIVDLGSGCGRFAMTLRDFHFHGQHFTGKYTGVDIDDQMLAWCRANFPSPHFTFINAGVKSSVYAPETSSAATSALPASSVPSALSVPSNRPAPWSLPIPNASQDFILSNSLFTHLTENHFVSYIREAGRMLKPGGFFQFSAFLIEEVRAAAAAWGGNPHNAGGRWTFQHRLGAAWVESPRYPEAATAYERDFINRTSREAGFSDSLIMPTHTQTMMRWRKM